MIIAHSIRTQKQSQNRILRFSFLNAIGVGLSFGTVIPLLALHYGAGDFAMTLLYAAIHVSAFAAVLVPFLLAGRGTSQVWHRGWLLRAFCSIGYLILPFLAADRIKVVVLLVFYYFFQIARSVGMSAYFTVVRSFCPAERLKSFSARNAIRFNTGLLLATSVAFAVLRIPSGTGTEWLYMGLLAGGTVFCFLSAGQLSRLPESGLIEHSRWRSVRRAAGLVMRNRALREVFLFSAGLSALAICYGFVINFLRNGIGYSPAEVFLITAFGIVVAIGASQLLRVIGDHVPSRVLLLVSTLLLLVCFLLWMTVPGILNSKTIWLHMLLFGAGSLALNFFGGVLVSLQSARLPGRYDVQITMCFQSATVLGALAVSGWLALSKTLVPAFLAAHSFSYVFLSGAVLLLLLLLLEVRMISERGSGLAADFAMLSAPNLLTMYRITRAETSSRQAQRELLLETAMLNPSRLSGEMLLGALRSPDAGQRFQAYRILGRIRLPAAFRPALEETLDVHSPLRREAITLLGLLGNKHAVAPLKKMLESGLPDELEAAVFKSLLRLGTAVDEGLLKDCYVRQRDPRARLDLLLGLTAAKQERMLLQLTADELAAGHSGSWVRTLMIHVADMYDRRETAVSLFEEEARRTGSGGSLLLREFGAVFEKMPEIDAALKARQFGEVLRLINEYGDPLMPAVPESETENMLGWVLIWCCRRENEG